MGGIAPSPYLFTFHSMEPLQGSDHSPAASELVLNPDGSVYHLGLFPEDIAERIFLVGDPGRVEQFSNKFDTLELKRRNREFLTHTGYYRGQRLSVLSTGIGTDNIDIVVTELDALVSFDLSTRKPLPAPGALEMIRVGTSGALQEDLAVDSFLLSELVIGMDGVMHAYGFKETEREKRVRKALEASDVWPSTFASPYVVEAAPELLSEFGDIERGITLTAHGFYGLQGRSLRLPLAHPSLNASLRAFEQEGLRVTNFEMESSALYGLASSLGHRACTICLLIANRYSGDFSADHEKRMDALIRTILDRSVEN